MWTNRVEDICITDLKKTISELLQPRKVGESHKCDTFLLRKLKGYVDYHIQTSEKPWRWNQTSSSVNDRIPEVSQAPDVKSALATNRNPKSSLGPIWQKERNKFDNSFKENAARKLINRSSSGPDGDSRDQIDTPNIPQASANGKIDAL
jgi:hypothetical protein